MLDVLDQLRNQARVLQRKAQAGDEASCKRLQQLPELAALDVATLATTVQRRHALALVAREQGFTAWGQLTAVLAGQSEGDFGTALYGPECYGHWNIWSASYEEARGIREEHGGYLLPYKRQFLIVERSFIDSLGLDPDDPDWQAIGRDWVNPGDVAARRRLYGKLIQHRSRAAPH